MKTPQTLNFCRPPYLLGKRGSTSLPGTAQLGNRTCFQQVLSKFRLIHGLWLLFAIDHLLILTMELGGEQKNSTQPSFTLPKKPRGQQPPS